VETIILNNTNKIQHSSQTGWPAGPMN